MRKEIGIAIFIFKMKKIDIFGDELTYQSHSVINLWVKAGCQTFGLLPLVFHSLSWLFTQQELASYRIALYECLLPSLLELSLPNLL